MFGLIIESLGKAYPEQMVDRMWKIAKFATGRSANVQSITEQSGVCDLAGGTVVNTVPTKSQGNVWY